MTASSLASSLPELPCSSIDWGAMLAAHRRWLEIVVRSRLIDSHATDDVLQEIALAVLKQSNRPMDKSKVAPWLYRIAIRKVVNYRRHLGRQRRLIDSYKQKYPDSGVFAPDREPEHWLLKNEIDSAVRDGLRQLTPSDRQILTLKYAENWGYREMAEHLGVSIKTIEYRLLKARNSLRELL